MVLMEIEEGHIHPIESTISECTKILSKYGYKFVSGPEIDNEYYNFEALNIPKNHPARDMWDTFWLKDRKGELLRTHTSAVQMRYLEENEPPIKIIVPGKVFRNEATDATHESQFFQLEGLNVDKDVTLSDAKGMLQNLFKELFGGNTEMRFRPSYFPFTEPSFEVDIKRPGEDWIEVLGAGMVQPLLLSRSKISPKEYQGFAFGLGIDRIAILRHGIDDIRLFYKGDIRFVNQF